MFAPKCYIPLRFEGIVAKMFRLHHEFVGIFPESIITVRAAAGFKDTELGV